MKQGDKTAASVSVLHDQSHTPEPWAWDSDPIKGDPFGRVRYRICAVGRTITQGYYSSGDERAEADIRRIVACVNACAGTSTKWLESKPVERQRRLIGNAVEVLDSIRALLNGERHPDDADRIVEMVNGFLDTARAEGKA